MVTLQAVVTLFGRLLIAIPCIVIGIALIIYWDNYISALEAQNIPVPMLFMVLAIVFLLLGGVAVVLGYWARIGAVLMMIPIIASLFTTSRFWDPTVEQTGAAAWGIWGSLGVTGGLIYILTYGSGKISLDRRRSKG